VAAGLFLPAVSAIVKKQPKPERKTLSDFAGMVPTGIVWNMIRWPTSNG